MLIITSCVANILYTLFCMKLEEINRIINYN